MFWNVMYPLSLNYSFDYFLWSFSILSSHMSQSAFSSDFLPLPISLSVLSSGISAIIMSFSSLLRPPVILDFCSSLHTHAYSWLWSSFSCPFWFSKGGSLDSEGKFWLPVHRIIEKVFVRKKYCSFWGHLWRQPCWPTMGLSKCELKWGLYLENRGRD